MTTFRLLRQTNRSSRFAQVTVEVAASSRPEVEVTATAADEHRREAELGARWALRGLPTAAKVTVTDVVITEIDTSVGDVYEATAHAVWQALRVEHRAPYVGFSDPEMVASWLTSMSGRRLDAVTEARHWHEGRRASDAESRPRRPDHTREGESVPFLRSRSAAEWWVWTRNVGAKLATSTKVVGFGVCLVARLRRWSATSGREPR